MPQPYSPDPSGSPPLIVRRCPTCRIPMFLAKIEPSEKDGHDERTFECSTCDYTESETVKFR
jgi:ribosomal protein S27AE